MADAIFSHALTFCLGIIVGLLIAIQRIIAHAPAGERTGLWRRFWRAALTLKTGGA